MSWQDEIRILKREIRKLQQQIASKRTPQGSAPRGSSSRKGVYVGKADSTIAALSGSTPGSGTVSIYDFNSSGVLVDSGRNETAYNTTSGTVAAAVFIQMKRHSQSGRLLIDVEDCS